jgi:hypothetical protein
MAGLTEQARRLYEKTDHSLAVDPDEWRNLAGKAE